MKSAREEILEKLRNAKTLEPEKPDFESPIYHPIEEPLDITFKKTLESVNGVVHLYSSKENLYDGLKNFLHSFDPENVSCFEKVIQQELENFEIHFSKSSEMPESIEAGITSCEFLIAHTGSVMVSSAQEGGRRMFVYPPVHIVIAKREQLVDYLDAAYLGIQNKYGSNFPSQITLITGPSRTADIEKTLVMGAHGPRELHVFIH